MAKKDDKPERVLGTGASGDPEHPEVGAPEGAPILDEDFAPVTEVETQRKDEEKK